MIFDSRFFHRSGVNDKTYWRLYTRTKNKNEEWKRDRKKYRTRQFCPALVSSFLFLLSPFPPLPLYLFTLSFRLSLVSGSQRREIYCKHRELIHGSGIYSTSAAPALLPRRGGLHLPRIKPVLLPPETGIMTLESVQRTNADRASA